jgi:dTDP-4-dehydrorhamnose reductase
VTTIELALAIIHLIKENKSGIYHLVNEEKIAKYDLLRLFIENFPDTGVTCLNPAEQYVVDKSLVNTRTDISYNVPSYETMVRQMKEWVIKNESLYPHYRFQRKE